MRVAKHNYIRFVAGEQLCRRGTAELVAVADMDGKVCQIKIARGRQIAARGIRVAIHRIDGRNRLDFYEDAVADVPGVQDQLDARQRVEDLGTHQTVRV